MEKKVKGIALLLFAIVLCLSGSEIQAILWALGIGVTVPFGVLSFLIACAGLYLVFAKG